MRHLLLLAALFVAAPAFAETVRMRVDVPPARVRQFHVARVSVSPTAGHWLDPNRRTEIQLIAPSDVAIDSRQDAEEAPVIAESGAEFSVRFKANAAGEKTFHVRLRFELCDAAGCHSEQEALAFAVTVR
jgi:hypothetical protein